MPAAIGETFGELVVVRLYKDVRFNGRPRYMAECKCSCGGRWRGERGALTSGSSKRCPACSSYSNGGNPVHGRSNGNGSVEGGYYIWRGIKQRMFNPNHHAFQDYGGRGLTIDPRWEEFETFLADMGERPSPDATIERVDNSRGYWPDNCVWASQTEQANNKRNNHCLTVNGQTKTLAEWSKETGMAAITISKRLDYGWSEDRAVSVPVAKAKRKYLYHTPMGVFETLQDAAKVHGITFGHVRRQIVSDTKPDWYRTEV